MATLRSGIAEFEQDLINERVKSDLSAAKARGTFPGRQKGRRPTSDRMAPPGPRHVRRKAELTLDRSGTGAQQEYRH